MNSKEYWRDREEQARLNHIRDEDRYKREIMAMYDDLQTAIEHEINSFYGKYATAEGISLSEAKKRASKLDIVAYERKAKQYVAEKNLSKMANDEMRLYNMTMKVNRLELLKSRIGLEMVDMFNKQSLYFEDILDERALETYQRMAGILGDSVDYSEKRIRSLVNQSWKGATFSEDIWGYEASLKSRIGILLTQGLIQGKGSQELARSLRKDFDVTRYESERLMRTELARVQIQAQIDSFKDAGVTELEFLALGDIKVCPVCSALDGKTFPITQVRIGDNTPPIHPNCRCSVAPAIEVRQISGLDLGAINLGIVNKGEFVPAQTMQEAKERFCDVLGIDPEFASFGRMKVELANQYLKGVEKFVKKFPKVRGMYASFDTKTGGKYIMGENRTEGRRQGDKAFMYNSLGLKSPQNYDDMMRAIKYSAESGYSLPNESPYTTAMHELTHGLSHTIQRKLYGLPYGDSATIDMTDVHRYNTSCARDVVTVAKEKVFGTPIAPYDEMKKALGEYALSNADETLAQAVAYELSGETNAISAEIYKQFVKKYKEAFE